ncbi:hypothetical protein F5144DRAFT_392021 [Chaetomium tenue]|uniref:Uncharacterized protein n=1 Tax=Chaetomium tenue TaxID=1854479 RepID=A0ACB7NVV2_9PEZI|nr:hypothetical protein F5144DRAFT_392021 [Chaetomium globosum]
MADPLSVAASVVGLLAVSHKVFISLNSFASIIMHTPKSLRRAVAEVHAVNGILGKVQKLIAWQSDAERPNNPGLDLIQLDHLVTTLTGCVLVFSELEKHIDGFEVAKSGSKQRIIWERVSWARKEKDIEKLMDDLHQHKTSLSLMLTIMQCTSQVEAVDCTRRLCSVMVDILESNRVISAQLRAVMTPQAIPDPPEDAASVTAERTAVSARSVPVAVQRPFERVLRKSKVYKYDLLWNVSTSSLGSLSTASTGRTSISTASLSEVSNISAIELPLQQQIIWNAKHYVEGGNTASTAVSGDDPRGLVASLDQQKSDDSPRDATVRDQQVNPVLGAFLNPILMRAFDGGLGIVGPVLVKGYIKVMPRRQLLLSAQLPWNVLINEFRRGKQDRLKPMFRAWTDVLDWFLETQQDQTLLQDAADLMMTLFNDLLERGEIEEAKYFFLTGTEATLRVVEMDNKRAASLTMDVCVRLLENALTYPYAAQFAAMVEDSFQKINLSTTVWGWMQSRSTAIAAVLLVQHAARLGMNNTLDLLVGALSVVQKRLSLNTHPHAWLAMVLGWEEDSWLLEVSVETAAVLLQYEREGAKQGLVIDGLRWILEVAGAANRLTEVLTLIGGFVGGLKEGASLSPVVPDGGQEGTVIGTVTGKSIQDTDCPSGDGGSDVGRALEVVLAALSRKHLDEKGTGGEA